MITRQTGSSKHPRKYLNLSTFASPCSLWIVLLNESQNSLHSYNFPLNFLISSFGNLILAAFRGREANVSSEFKLSGMLSFNSLLLKLSGTLSFHSLLCDLDKAMLLFSSLLISLRASSIQISLNDILP